MASFWHTGPHFGGKNIFSEMGPEWIKEQEIRREEGFCYADVRCGKCIIPH